MTVIAGDLTTNALADPLGIDSAQPEFAWRLVTDDAAVMQSAFAIQVASDENFSTLVWDSREVMSDRPYGAVYAGSTLDSRRRYWWRVRVRCTVGNRSGEPGTGTETTSEWSPAAWFETAILDPAWWQARWIGGPPAKSKADDPVLYLRKDVELSASVVRARAYVSALGWYRFFVNGHDLTVDALVPRFTPYSEVVEYQTYDVTPLLRRGPNILAVAVGDGRYRGSLGLLGSRESYGKRIGALAQLEVDLSNGSTVTVATDHHWFAGPGRITGSDPKNGERADLRIPDADWLTGTSVPDRFATAALLPQTPSVLIAEEVERVGAVDRLTPVVGRAPSGAQLLDFGQNFAGVVRVRLSGPSGSVVQLTHGELLTPAGELDTDSIVTGRRWYQRELITLAGEDDWYQPWFTIHGFRYVEVIGLPRLLEAHDAEGIVLSSDLASTGDFACSDPRLDQLRRNVSWSVRSNFTDTPTDCPTRERAGWTGDIQVFGPTAALLVGAQAFLRRYLRNAALEQYPDGATPIYIPSEQPIRRSIGRRMMHIMSTSVGWSDVIVLLPWTMYQYYGDRAVLERHYDGMRRWVDRMERVARTRRGRGRPRRASGGRAARSTERYVLASDFHFGEWLRPGETGTRLIARNLIRPPAVVATAYFAHSSLVLSHIAEVLGHGDDAERYRALSTRVREAWRSRFVSPAGRIGEDRQDDYVRALAFDLLLPDQRPGAVARLGELIEAAGYHLGTGFLSTPMLLEVLVDGGRADLAARLLFQTTSPSWLYQVEHGATTTWETWEGFRPDGRGKESHNHYAPGTVAGWLTEGLAGLTPGSPGYRRIRIAPLIMDGLDQVTGSVDTPYGPARSAWRRQGDHVSLQVDVPAGAVADIHLPPSGTTPSRPIVVGSGPHTFTWPST